MSRRMDREGVHRMDLQGIMNRHFWDDPRCVENERGWIVPFANWQGWQALNRAGWHLRYRLIVLRDLISPYERAEHIRCFKYNIEESRRCDRPSLPDRAIAGEQDE